MSSRIPVCPAARKRRPPWRRTSRSWRVGWRRWSWRPPCRPPSSRFAGAAAAGRAGSAGSRWGRARPVRGRLRSRPGARSVRAPAGSAPQRALGLPLLGPAESQGGWSWGRSPFSPVAAARPPRVTSVPGVSPSLQCQPGPALPAAEHIAPHCFPVAEGHGTCQFWLLFVPLVRKVSQWCQTALDSLGVRVT